MTSVALYVLVYYVYGAFHGICRIWNMEKVT